MPKIIDNLREALIKEAKYQVNKYGYAGMTIRSVAKECGIGIGTIYNYFKSKEDLILAFMHEPIAPKSGVGEVWAVWPSDGNPESYDFDTVGVGADPNADEATRAVYALLTENADVIRGIFCGHMHSVFYTEVRASYTDKCGRHEALIPQFCSHGNSYHHHAGIVTRIIVK